MAPPGPAIGDISLFGVNVHYHMPGPADEADDARRGRRPVAEALLIASVSLAAGVLLSAVPWRKLFHKKGRGRRSIRESLYDRLSTDANQRVHVSDKRTPSNPGMLQIQEQQQPPESMSPPRDMLTLIERQRLREAAAAAAESRLGVPEAADDAVSHATEDAEVRSFHSTCAPITYPAPQNL
mmetsp:Transcript_47028/g.117721  ORF Transcript_47028/g.117721 Transcript_47028/m.117721 type:complete len:182 (-) Transcript_47028:1838-2383(-)